MTVFLDKTDVPNQPTCTDPEEETGGLEPP